MAGELILGLEIVLFFMFIYFIERKRYKLRQTKIVLNKTELELLPHLLVQELKPKLDNLGDSQIFLTPEDILYTIYRLKKSNNKTIR